MRDELDDLFCRIYVDGLVDSDELARLLAEDLGGARTGNAITVGKSLLQVRASDGYDPDRRHEQLSGFLYFPLHIEVAALAGQDRVAHIGVTRRTLESLWAHKLTAVASCDYEQALPNEGYNSRYVP